MQFLIIKNNAKQNILENFDANFEEHLNETIKV